MSFLASAADERVLGVKFSDDALSQSRSGKIINHRGLSARTVLSECALSGAEHSSSHR